MPGRKDGPPFARERLLPLLLLRVRLRDVGRGGHQAHGVGREGLEQRRERPDIFRRADTHADTRRVNEVAQVGALIRAVTHRVGEVVTHAVTHPVGAPIHSLHLGEAHLINRCV